MHNIKHGLINYCQICKSKRIKNHNGFDVGRIEVVIEG